MNEFDKDPSAVLDYQFDWSSWLTTDETISAAVITITPVPAGLPPVGLTAGTPTINSGIVTVWLSGGLNGSRYIVACKITTNQNRVDERSVFINCFDR